MPRRFEHYEVGGVESDLIPWASPYDVEMLLELLERAISILNGAAQWGSLRKDHRREFESLSLELQQTVSRLNQGMVSESLMRAVKSISETEQHIAEPYRMLHVIVNAIEDYVSERNKKRKA